MKFIKNISWLGGNTTEDIKPFEVSAEESSVGISSYCFKIDSTKPQYIGRLYFIKKGSGLGCNINLEYKSSDKQNLAFYLDKLHYGFSKMEYDFGSQWSQMGRTKV